jgi:hypothetical protein
MGSAADTGTPPPADAVETVAQQHRPARHPHDMHDEREPPPSHAGHAHAPASPPLVERPAIVQKPLVHKPGPEKPADKPAPARFREGLD